MNKKTVIITGVSRGIGKAIAQKFMEEGFNVVGVSRRKPKYKITYHIQADLTEEDSRKKVIDETVRRFGRIDILVNNAGIGIYESWEDMSIKELLKVFEVDFFAPVHLTQLALPYIKESKGTVINISSVAGELYVPYKSGYTAAKHALHAFSETLRMETKEYGINVITVTVGNVKTGFTLSAYGTKNPILLPFPGKRKELADKIYNAYIKRKSKLTYPSWYRAFIIFSKLFPKGYEHIIMRIWDRSFKKKRAIRQFQDNSYGLNKTLKVVKYDKKSEVKYSKFSGSKQLKILK